MFLEPDAASVIGRQYAIYLRKPYATPRSVGIVGIHQFDIDVDEYADSANTARKEAVEYIEYIRSCFACITYTTPSGERYKDDMFRISSENWRILDCRAYSQAIHEGATLLRYYFDQRRAFRAVLRLAGLDAGTAHMIAAEFFPFVKI